MNKKHSLIIQEVLDEIESAIKDPKGIVSHQRRLAFSLSLGTVSLIEIYLDKLNVFKTGAKINHLWLKKKKDNVKKLVSNQLTCPIESIKDFDKILNIAYEIEKERNEIAYGKPVSESLLRDKINLFLDLKKEVESD